MQPKTDAYLKICFPKHIITKQPQILNYGQHLSSVVRGLFWLYFDPISTVKHAVDNTIRLIRDIRTVAGVPIGHSYKKQSTTYRGLSRLKLG